MSMPLRLVPSPTYVGRLLVSYAAVAGVCGVIALVVATFIARPGLAASLLVGFLASFGAGVAIGVGRIHWANWWRRISGPFGHHQSA